MALARNASYHTLQNLPSARDGASSSNVRMSDTYRSTLQIGSNDNGYARSQDKNAGFKGSAVAKNPQLTTLSHDIN